MYTRNAWRTVKRSAALGRLAAVLGAVTRGAAEACAVFMSTGADTAIILRMSAKSTEVPNERLDYDTPFVEGGA